MIRRSFVVMALCVALSPLLCIADTRFEGKTIAVLDGDTIDVLTQDKQKIRIRLANIDAPEKSQAFGQRSRQNLASMVAGKSVEVIDTGGDQYGRRVGRVLIAGTEVNVEKVRAGYAWVYVRYNHDGRLPALEAAARQEGLGLWVDAHPQAPWLYRHSR